MTLPHVAYLPATDAEGEWACLTVGFKPGVENHRRAFAQCKWHKGHEVPNGCPRCAMARIERTRYLIDVMRKAHAAYREKGYVVGWQN